MSSAPDYSTATNKAYEILSKVDPFNLETDINKILSLFPKLQSIPTRKSLIDFLNLFMIIWVLFLVSTDIRFIIHI